MSRKHETDYAAELENNYARWDKVFTEGGSDPFWADGVSLSLIRSQILYCKARKTGKFTVRSTRDLLP